MNRLRLPLLMLALPLLAALAPQTAWAADSIGQIKTASGAVTVEHEGKSHGAGTGDRVFAADIVATGPDGSVGITFADNSMMSLGPDSRLTLDQFQFDTTTHVGVFDTSLQKGTLAVKSGQICAQTPEAMHVKTPAAILGVRGTEFVVRAD